MIDIDTEELAAQLTGYPTQRIYALPDGTWIPHRQTRYDEVIHSVSGHTEDPVEAAKLAGILLDKGARAVLLYRSVMGFWIVSPITSDKSPQLPLTGVCGTVSEGPVVDLP